uniref:Uncharacterized protein n=1 Tax=Hordeum vulgare subsp. vulgare TaxID=112509 RepID=A0A8I6Z3B0_HORVV
MVYEDESSNDLSSLDISSSSDDMMYRIPASIDDEDNMGIDNSTLDVCLEHGLPPEHRVAFEGFETGRRFLVCAQPEERVLDLSYMKVNGHGAESSSSAVSVMKSEIEKKEAEIMEVKGKYSVLMNLAEAQGRVIRTQKANHLKEKEKLSEENYNLKVQVDKLSKSEDKLNDEIVVLNLHIDDPKKGVENLIKRRDELKLQIADQLKALEKNQEKLKMIRDILDG